MSGNIVPTRVGTHQDGQGEAPGRAGGRRTADSRTGQLRLRVVDEEG